MKDSIQIRTYVESDWTSIEKIHDSARKLELSLAGLEAAFLPLKIAAENEGLFDYGGIFVAEENGELVGFAACSESELAWLYVHPEKLRRGIGRKLSQHTLQAFPTIQSIEVLKGNEPALALYKSLGFRVVGEEKGVMPGNETFSVEVYLLER